jgi:uncharacterized membrane protein affecting hemolysin expression
MKTEEQRLLDELYDRNDRIISHDDYDYTVTNKNSNQTILNLEDYPDAKKHQIVSFIKSGIRILGYILIPFDLLWAAGILVISELVGIIEELV